MVFLQYANISSLRWNLDIAVHHSWCFVLPDSATMHTKYLLCVSALCLLLPVNTQAQDAAEAENPHAWQIKLTTRLSGSQVSFRNWEEGGINTISFGSAVDGSAVRNGGLWEQRHDLKLGYGLVKQDTLAFRKAEDQIQIDTAIKYKGEGFFRHFRPTVASSIRTQFDEGFNYKKNPFGDDRDPPVKVSDFFAPATLTQTVGLTFDAASWLTQRLAIGAKETVVTIERFRELYDVNPEKNAKFELGVESRNALDREILDNVRLKSVLRLFASFNKKDAPDMLWENLVAMKVNAWLNVNFEWVMLYDKDITKDLQMKEVFSLGVSLNLI